MTYHHFSFTSQLQSYLSDPLPRTNTEAECTAWISIQIKLPNLPLIKWLSRSSLPSLEEAVSTKYLWNTFLTTSYVLITINAFLLSLWTVHSHNALSHLVSALSTATQCLCLPDTLPKPCVSDMNLNRSLAPAHEDSSQITCFLFLVHLTVLTWQYNFSNVHIQLYTCLNSMIPLARK